MLPQILELFVIVQPKLTAKKIMPEEKNNNQTLETTRSQNLAKVFIVRSSALIMALPTSIQAFKSHTMTREVKGNRVFKKYLRQWQELTWAAWRQKSKSYLSIFYDFGLDQDWIEVTHQNEHAALECGRKIEPINKSIRIMTHAINFLIVVQQSR